jgi:hypothetical protein
MCRGGLLAAFCRRHAMPIVTVEELAAYLRSSQPAITAV